GVSSAWTWMEQRAVPIAVTVGCLVGLSTAAGVGWVVFGPNEGGAVASGPPTVAQSLSRGFTLPSERDTQRVGGSRAPSADAPVSKGSPSLAPTSPVPSPLVHAARPAATTARAAGSPWHSGQSSGEPTPSPADPSPRGPEPSPTSDSE